MVAASFILCVAGGFNGGKYFRERERAVRNGLADVDELRLKLLHACSDFVVNAIVRAAHEFVKKPDETSEDCAKRAYQECEAKFKQQTDIEACAAETSHKC